MLAARYYQCLFCVVQSSEEKCQNELWSGGTCLGQYLEPVGRAEDAAVSVECRKVPDKAGEFWQCREQRSFASATLFFLTEQHFPLLPKVPSTLFISACHFSSWSLKSGGKIVFHFVIFLI